MANETLTEEQFLNFLSLAPTNLIDQAGIGLTTALQSLPEDSPDAKGVAMMLMMLAGEYQLRQIEPLWRKAQRFAIRNSETFKEIGKIAACVGVGVILGQSLNIKK